MSGLSDAEREVLLDSVFTAGPGGRADLIATVERIVAARVAAAGQQRDQYCAAWYSAAERAGIACDRAEAADQARAEVEAKMRALADEWERISESVANPDRARLYRSHAAHLRCAALSDPAAPEEDCRCNAGNDARSPWQHATMCPRFAPKAEDRAHADEQAIRERIAQDIEARGWNGFHKDRDPHRRGYQYGIEDAARIAREGGEPA